MKDHDHSESRITLPRTGIMIGFAMNGALDDAYIRRSNILSDLY